MDCGDGKVRAEIGAFQAPVAKVAAYTILHTDAGKIFTNTLAGGPVTFTLPATAAGTPGVAPKRITGMFFYFVRTADQNIVIAVQTGAKINNGTVSTGTYVGSGAIGSTWPSAKVTAISETEWIVDPILGTWGNV